MIFPFVWDLRSRSHKIITYGACADTTISELLTTILTTPLESATPISYNSEKFRLSESTGGRFGPFFFAHAHESALFTIQVRNSLCCHRRSQRHQLPINGQKFCQFDSVSNSYFSASGYNMMTTPLDSMTTIS